MRSSLLILLTTLVLAVLPGSASATSCDLVAAPNGSDRAAGAVDTPLRSPQAVLDRLEAGQTGCLRAGTYSGRRDPNFYVARFNHGGAPGRPIVLRSYPGERATLAGVVYVPKGSDDVTVSDLMIDDPTSYDYSQEMTVMVDAKRTQLLRDEITNHNQKTCVILGIAGWGRAIDTVIRDSVLRDCGDWDNGVYDHAIYAARATGVRIEGNVIRNTGGYGLHLYPDAQRSLVRNNVITHNGGGIIFAGEGRLASNHNVVTRNAVSDSVKRPDLSSYWGRRVGRGNVADHNCIGGAVDDHRGFASRDNTVGTLRFGSGLDVLSSGSCGGTVPGSIAALAVSL